MSEGIIKSARLIENSVVDIRVTNGVISDISQNISGDVLFDAGQNLILPGLVDLHTHLREPGREDSETVLTGSNAAVKGGYTAISPMANTLPVADTAGVVEQVFSLGIEAGLCDVFPIGAVTQGLAGQQLSEIVAMNNSKANVKIFSDDGENWVTQKSDIWGDQLIVKYKSASKEVALKKYFISESERIEGYMDDSDIVVTNIELVKGRVYVDEIKQDTFKDLIYTTIYKLENLS